jgi:hypothetical protein
MITARWISSYACHMSRSTTRCHRGNRLQSSTSICISKKGLEIEWKELLSHQMSASTLPHSIGAFWATRFPKQVSGNECDSLLCNRWRFDAAAIGREPFAGPAQVHLFRPALIHCADGHCVRESFWSVEGGLTFPG